MKSRYINANIKADLKKKMVFLGGPRQVGKTTLALGLLKGSEKHPNYYNYDFAEDRERLFTLKWPEGPLVVLDEIHKYSRWKNWLKGVYDKTKSERSYLITGSARLDLYRKGGDSLQGRYHYYRLHPLSVAELQHMGEKINIEKLLECGGFPEPYFLGDVDEARRWRRERRHRIIREDLRDLERVIELSLLEQLVARLPKVVGNPLSIQALSEDLQVAHQTAAHWIEILERFYYCYRIYPFGSDRIRAVKKEPKLYLWDWSEVTEPGYRFENMVAGHLLKYCHYMEDTKGHDMELRYVRDRDGREVDFVVIQNQKPLFAVECKLTDPSLTRSMHYFKERTSIPKFYLVHAQNAEKFVDTPGLMKSVSATEFLKQFV